MQMVNDKKELMEKMLRMENQGISKSEIAAVFSLEQDQLSQILGSDDYKKMKADALVEKAEEADTRNNAWDTVEDLALGHLVETLQIAPDPDFALKVAAVANKAQRRQSANAPIAGSIAGRTVLHMNLNFVQKLQTAFQVSPREEQLKTVATRDVNMMSIRDVQEAFSENSREVEQLEHLFNERI